MTVEQRQQIKPDICVIGAGAGGLAAASAAAAFGVNVVLIEKAKMGGEALNSGALPSKALLAAAARANACRDAARFGIKSPRFGVDFAAVRAHVRDVVAAVEPQDSRERFNGLGVRVFAGEGRFTDAETVAVNGYDVKARRFVIATGSSPALPAIPGLADTPHLTNETIFDLAECPRHLIVIGADSIGLELAQAFRRFGAEVTVLEPAAPLAGADPECASRRARRARARGRRAALRRRHPAGAPVRWRACRSISLPATMPSKKRRPSKAVICSSRWGGGRIWKISISTPPASATSRAASSSTAGFAPPTSTSMPSATSPARRSSAISRTIRPGLVIRNALFRTPVDADRYAVPVVTYTDPELAQVGLTEDEARAQAGVIRVLRAPYRENDRARATGATNGHIKIVTDRKGDYSRRHHRRGGGVGKYRGLDARHKPKAEYRGLCRCYRAVSDLCRGGQTRRDDLFHSRFDEPSGASHHRVAASFWLISVSRKPQARP